MYFCFVIVGDEVLIEMEIVQVSKRMVVLRGIMRRKSDGKIVMICEYQKVNIDKDVYKFQIILDLQRDY